MGRENLKFIDIPFIQGLEALSGVNISNCFKRHVHKSYIIGRVTRGARLIIRPDGVIRVSESEIFIINPGQVHICRSVLDTGHSYQIICITPEKMRSCAALISEKAGNRPYFGQTRVVEKGLSDNLGNLFTLFKGASSELMVENNLTDFLSEIILKYSETPPLSRPLGEHAVTVKRVCDYIDANFHENVSLDKLAKVACMSPFHLQRIFTGEVGISPHDYLIQHRIDRSRELLLKSGNVSDTAVATGFFDQSHFSKAFKRNMGIAPGGYIKANS